MISSVEGWTLCRLGDLVFIDRQIVRPDTLPGETPYVGLEHVESGIGVHTSISLAEAALRSDKFRFRIGDVLFGKLRPNLRKVAVANCSGVCSTDLIPLRPKDPGVSFLVAFQLRSVEFTAAVMRMVSGQNLPRIGVRDLLDLQLPVPPKGQTPLLLEFAELLDEARRTACELDRRVKELHDSATALLYPISSAGAPLRRTKSI